jgi:pimeloyl-ACP methyl ester carboxylesterase
MDKSRVHRFTVSVPCKTPFADEVKEYDDWCFIILPDKHSKDGEPVRLVINCHGAGGTVTTDDSKVEHQAMTQYLVANGYAVMCVGGLPQEFADLHGIDIRNNMGCPIATESNVRAYHYCMEKFNLKKEVLVLGSSMGGLSSTNLVLSKRIPVLAHACFCPVLDTYNQPFLHPWSGGLPRTALGLFYSFDKDEAGNFIYDEEKVMGCNPAQNPQRLHYPCPALFCQCENDHIVNPAVTKKFVAEVKEAGNQIELFMLPEGGHEPQLWGDGNQSTSGNTSFDGETLVIKPGPEKVFRWLRYQDFTL